MNEFYQIFLKSEMSVKLFLLVIASAGLLSISLPFGLSAPHGRIVGGTDAMAAEFPYQVNVQAFDFDQNRWVSICGGSIINPTTILSAAHCMLYGFSAAQDSLFRIVAGELDTEIHEGSEQWRDVKQIVAHYQFDYFTYENDVALFIVEKPLEFNTYVQAIKLPSIGQETTGYGVVTGWGLDEETAQSPPHILQKIRVPIIDSQKCKEQYGDGYNADSMMCAGGDENGDACAGDSGGPLAAVDEDGNVYVASIVSWGVGCGRPNYPGVYTKTSHFVDWILWCLSEIN